MRPRDGKHLVGRKYQMILMENLVRQLEIRETLVGVVNGERQVAQLLEYISHSNVGVHRREVFDSLNPRPGVFEPRLIERHMGEKRGLKKTLGPIEVETLLEIPVIHLVIWKQRGVRSVEGSRKDLQCEPWQET